MKAWVLSSSNALVSGSPSYAPVAIGRGQIGSSLASLEVIYYDSGTFSNLYLKVYTNTTSGSSTLTLYKNAASSALTLSIPAATTGEFTDTANTVSCTGGDAFCYVFTLGSGQLQSGYALGVAFEKSSGTGTVIAGGGGSLTTASVTRYIPLIAGFTWQSTTTIQRQGVGTAGTFKRLRVYVTANARTTATTARLRKNNANGNQSVSIGSTATGTFVDAVNSDACVYGDDWHWSITTGTGTQSITLYYNTHFDSTGDEALLLTAVTGIGTGTDTRYAIAGDQRNTTEANTQSTVPFDVTFSKMTIYVATNTATTTSTVRFRVNGADGSQAISIATTLTGDFTDASNSDVTVSGDIVNMLIDMTAGSGTLSGTSLSLSALEVIPVPPTIKKVVGIIWANVKKIGPVVKASVKKAMGISP